MEIGGFYSFDKPQCNACQAGKTVWFAWKLDEAPRAFVLEQYLRIGKLYRCSICHRPWYLDGFEKYMYSVEEQRVPLVLQWNERPIRLQPELIAKLREIGRTPPDQYGNRRQYDETPCGVVTTAGERIDMAIVSLQAHAPVERGRDCRLATEVAEIYESPFALPLAVRFETSQANGLRMGYAPTTVEMPDGHLFELNWQPNFIRLPAYIGSQAKLTDRRIDWRFEKQKPTVIGTPKGVVYFVADE